MEPLRFVGLEVALLAVGDLLAAKYPDKLDRWKGQPVELHSARAIRHHLKHGAGARDELHLVHAAARSLFALACWLKGESE